MGFSYIKVRAQEISQKGTGNPEWAKPITNEEYEAQRRYSNSDISIEQVMFREPEIKTTNNDTK